MNHLANACNVQARTVLGQVYALKVPDMFRKVLI